MSGVLAFIIAAVSPAVVVPQMLRLKELGFGQNKEVPTLVLAGASIDDVVAITIFGAFIKIAQKSTDSLIGQLFNIPLSIITGILAGAIVGFLLHFVYQKIKMRATKQALVFIAGAIILFWMEHDLNLPLASLLGVMTIGFVILEKDSNVATKLAAKFNKIWVFAEIILFVLIGAAVKTSVMLDAGLIGLAILALGLIARSIGVWAALIGSELNKKEKLFCSFAYLPKATVQAAIGATPLALGLPHGEIILAIAVLSIIVTAPLGAFLIRGSAPILLKKTDNGILDSNE